MQRVHAASVCSVCYIHSVWYTLHQSCQYDSTLYVLVCFALRPRYRQSVYQKCYMQILKLEHRAEHVTQHSTQEPTCCSLMIIASKVVPE